MTTIKEAYHLRIVYAREADYESRLVWAFQYFRKKRPDMGAAECLTLARNSTVDPARVLYPSSAVAAGYGPAFTPSGSSTPLRWMEAPEAAGLRFVGYADELASLRHTGWFADDYQEETYRGVVYQLSARKGCERFIYGYVSSEESERGAACLHFSIEDSGKEAAICADSIAESRAEADREWRQAGDARHEYDEAGEEVAAMRRDALELIAEIKALRRATPTLLDSAPNACGAITESVRRALGSIRATRERRAELQEMYGHHSGWQTG